MGPLDAWHPGLKVTPAAAWDVDGAWKFSARFIYQSAVSGCIAWVMTYVSLEGVPVDAGVAELLERINLTLA